MFFLSMEVNLIEVFWISDEVVGVMGGSVVFGV